MRVQYTMKVTGLEVYPECEGKTNMVRCARWTLSATDGVKTFTYPGCTTIPYNPEHHWWEYEDLIENEVLEWISKNAADEIMATRASLALNFPDAMVEQDKPLPWG
jgi:hypothetical protein